MLIKNAQDNISNFKEHNLSYDKVEERLTRLIQA